MLTALAAGFVLGGAVYLLLIDTTQLPELYVGAAVALMAAAAFVVAREQGRAEAKFAPSMLVRSWRLLVRIPADIGRVSLAAIEQLLSPRASHGRLRVVEFRHGRAGSGRDVGRRALAEALGSLPPNTIVIGIDPDQDLLLAHQLRADSGAGAIDVLELG